MIDFVILQQDAFDAIDCNTSLERQEYMVNRIIDICNTDFAFDDFSEVAGYFKEVINAFKQMNYAEYQSEGFNEFSLKVEELIKQRAK